MSARRVQLTHRSTDTGGAKKLVGNNTRAVTHSDDRQPLSVVYKTCDPEQVSNLRWAILKRIKSFVVEHSHIHNHGVHGAVAKRQTLGIPGTRSRGAGRSCRSSRRLPHRLAIPPQVVDRVVIHLSSEHKHVGEPASAQKRNRADTAHAVEWSTVNDVVAQYGGVVGYK